MSHTLISETNRYEMGGRCKKNTSKKSYEDDYEDEDEDDELKDYSCYNDDDAKNKHGVEFNISVNSKDADAVRNALIRAGHTKIADKLEIKRELSIMHEVMACEGDNIMEKADNCIEKWRKGNYGCVAPQDTREPKYKMKHKVFHATKTK